MSIDCTPSDVNSKVRKNNTKDDPKVKHTVCVGGGAGFIGSHLAKRLKEEGHHVIVADWVRNKFFKEEDFCHEFKLLDLRTFDSAKEATKGCDWVFNLAADMGGMGFIQSNHSAIIFNSAMITFSMLEAARQNGCKRFFFSSSACVYPEYLQVDESKDCSLREDTAWPAQPQDAYGLEKLFGEEACLNYGRDFDMETRIARFHNIYGGHATWKGGREKAPAAFTRKVIVAKQKSQVEMWGNGKQTRSFCHVDDCVEGVLRLMRSDYCRPLNIGSDEMVSMNDMMQMCAKIDKKKIHLKHIDGPEGVRGRNSDNTLCKKVLGWAPSISLHDGLVRTHKWIKAQIDAEIAAGVDVSVYGSSTVVQQSTQAMDNIGDVSKNTM